MHKTPKGTLCLGIFGSLMGSVDRGVPCTRAGMQSSLWRSWTQGRAPHTQLLGDLQSCTPWLTHNRERDPTPPRQHQAPHRHHLWLNKECFDHPRLNFSLFYFAFSIFSNALRPLWRKISYCKRNVRIKPEKPSRFGQKRNYSFSDCTMKATHTEGAR